MDAANTESAPSATRATTVTVHARAYDHARDCDRIGRFLIDTYPSMRGAANWLQPRWEYMHYLCVPFFGLADDLQRIGIFEDGGRVVGVVHFEEHLGQAYFQVHPDYSGLEAEMLGYAEANLAAQTRDGRRFLQAFVSDRDAELESTLAGRGYQEHPGDGEVTSSTDIASVGAPESLPAGFVLHSLAEDNNLAEVVRVLHRGFNHPGEPPDRNVEVQRTLQSAPGFRPELVWVARSPDGHYVSYCGVWLEPTNRLAMVEPVATDPDYRGLGLGTGVVRQAARKAGELGATVAYVGSARSFYQAMGFRQVASLAAWDRTWPADGG